MDPARLDRDADRGRHARSVTPAQATSASQQHVPRAELAAVAAAGGMQPASAIARPVLTEQEMPAPRSPLASSVTTALRGACS